MEKVILNVGFNLMREVFEEYAIGDDFIIFDNLMEKINPEGNPEVFHYDSPIKLDIAITAVCTEGSCTVKAGLNEIVLEKGRIAIFLPGQIFQIVSMTPDLRGMFMVTSNDFFNFHNYFMEMMVLYKVVLQQLYFEVPDSFIAEFVTVYNLIKDKIREEDNHYRKQIIQNYCGVFFYNVCNIYIEQGRKAVPQTKSRREEIFETFLREVEKSYRDEHAMGFYAEKLFLTPKYLSTVVAEVSGKSAADWIDDYLVLEAKALLRFGNKTIQQVSDELNFSNQSHFGRFFKRHTGMSPKEYKRT